MEPSPKYLFALLFIFIGVFTYYWFIYKHKRPKLMGKLFFTYPKWNSYFLLFSDKVTYTVQMLFEALPSNPQVTLSCDKDDK